VDELQAVVAHALLYIEIVADNSVVKKFNPEMVTEVPPDATVLPFCPKAKDTTGASKERTLMAVPTVAPTITRASCEMP